MDYMHDLAEQVKLWRDALEDEDKFIQYVLYEDGGDLVDALDKFLNEDILDIYFIVGLDCKVREVGVLVAFGGPNVYVKTDGTNVTVEGYWGGHSYTTQGRDNIGLFDYLRELYAC